MYTEIKQYEKVIIWKENRWFQSVQEQESCFSASDSDEELEDEEDFDGSETDDFSDWESYEIEQFTS